MSSTAEAKSISSVNANVCSETQPIEGMLEVNVFDSITEHVNLSKDLVQPKLHV